VVVPDTLRYLWPALAVLIVVTVVWPAPASCVGPMSSCGQRPWLVGGAAVGFATQWAFSNAYIPAVFFPVLAASVLSGRLLLHALDNRRWLVAVPTCAVLLGLAWQNQHIPRAKLAAYLPQPSDTSPPDAARSPAQRPRDLFIPFHTYYAALVGKRTFVHRMGVRDVGAGLGRPEGLIRHCRGSSSRPSCWTGRPCRRVSLYRLALSPVVAAARRGGFGAHVRWRADLSQRPAGPHLGSAARASRWPPPADFETGTWQIFVAEGEAFGNGPAPRAPGCTAALLRIPPAGPGCAGDVAFRTFHGDQSHLGFVLSGPADRGCVWLCSMMASRCVRHRRRARPPRSNGTPAIWSAGQSCCWWRTSRRPAVWLSDEVVTW